MPRLKQPMKDAVGGEMLRGAVKQAMIRRSPNGATYPPERRMFSQAFVWLPIQGRAINLSKTVLNIPRIGSQAYAWENGNLGN